MICDSLVLFEMERFSQRESVLLGCSPQSQRSLDKVHDSPKAQQRNSDIDFNDVFGGPPRRFSINGTRCSFSQGTDDCAFRGVDRAVISSNSWNGLCEKPVFGEEGFNRSRRTNENFFDDIFKGNESLCCSPRKCDWDPYSLSPNCQVLSPARPLPPKAEPFGTSLPAEFSLPAKLTKGMELPTFGSAPRSPSKSKDFNSNGISCYSSPLSRSSSLNHRHEERNDHRSSYRQSLLCRESSLSSKESSNLTRSAEADTGAMSKKELNSSEGLTSSSQFHFSIYKWASKGVPLAMPLRGGSSIRSRDNSNTDRCLSSCGWKAKESELSTETLHDTKLSLNEVPANAKSFVMEHDKQKNSTPSDTNTQDRVELQQRVDVGNTISQNIGEETTSNSKCQLGLHNKLEKVSAVAEEVQEPELKPLDSLFYDNDYEQSNMEITRKPTEKERMEKGTKKASVVHDFSKSIKKDGGKRATLENAEVGKDSQQGSPVNSRDPGKIKSKGRVKDFVKIFNQEGFSKPKISVDPQTQSSRWRRTGNTKAEKEANFSKTGTDQKIHKSSWFEKKLSPNTPTTVNENLPHSEKQQSDIKRTNLPNGTSGPNDSSSSESLGNASKAVVGDTDETFPENFLVKELTQDENKLPKAGKDPEDIQVIDAKIQKWVDGKSGNIRSLLSTLQYVLWPESGWKTVPLVDIIEGSAVKRSYQKALLYLHPDKLQQKGATSEHKYIAEKVFDILQEAWTHFNSLGSY